MEERKTKSNGEYCIEAGLTIAEMMIVFTANKYGFDHWSYRKEDGKLVVIMYMEQGSKETVVVKRQAEKVKKLAEEIGVWINIDKVEGETYLYFIRGKNGKGEEGYAIAGYNCFSDSTTIES